MLGRFDDYDLANPAVQQLRPLLGQLAPTLHVFGSVVRMFAAAVALGRVGKH